MLSIIAWLVLRITFAAVFSYPIYGFLKNWTIAKETASLLYPRFATLQAIIMIVVMFISSISILLGFYGRIGGLIALVFTLIGVKVHYTFAKNLLAMTLPVSTGVEERAIFDKAKTIGSVGHITSAQKNYLIAAISFFIVLLGTGPFSLTG